MSFLTTYFYQSPEAEMEDEEELIAVQQECLSTFECKDFIMEPGVCQMLKR